MLQLCVAFVIVTSGKCERCPIRDTLVRGLRTSSFDRCSKANSAISTNPGTQG